MLGVTHRDLRTCVMELVANDNAILGLLIQKGIVTEEEFNVRKLQSISIVDQAMAKKDEEARDEFDVEHPGFRDSLKLFGLEE